MAFALLIAGTVLLISAVRNTQGTLFTLLQGDFSGPNNFVYWFVAILLIGALGYIPALKPISTAFLGLVVLVLILTRGNPQGIGGGFFSQFVQQIQTTNNPTAPTTVNPISTVFSSLSPSPSPSLSPTSTQTNPILNSGLLTPFNSILS